MESPVLFRHRIRSKTLRKLGHLVFTVLNLINNFFGCSSMILTGSQLVVGITGMPLQAATILIPIGGECAFQRIRKNTDGGFELESFCTPLWVESRRPSLPTSFIPPLL